MIASTKITYDKPAIHTRLSDDYTDHFKEWARLLIAVRYIEKRYVLSVVYVEILYEEVTGRKPLP